MEGIIPPLVTPVTQDGVVCEQSVKNLINSLSDGGYAALMPLLSSGEGRYVDEDQWRDMVIYTKKYGRTPVFPGVVRETTDEVISLARHAKDLGVDGIAVTTPFGRDVSQADIVEHFQKIYDAVKIPIFLYNEELISGNAIEISTFASLFYSVPIVGVKESSGDIEIFKKLLSISKGVPVFQGWENLACASANGAGFIFPLANLDCGLCNNAYTVPSDEVQARIDAECERYGLFEDDWYKRIKKELKSRNLISTGLSIEEAGMAYA